MQIVIPSGKINGCAITMLSELFHMIQNDTQVLEIKADKGNIIFSVKGDVKNEPIRQYGTKPNPG